jgi:hypothetical protein
MAALGMEGMILRYLLSGTQADSAGRKFDEPLVNSMGIGLKSTQQKAASATKFQSKRERKIAKQHRRNIVVKKKAKKPKKVKEEAPPVTPAPEPEGLTSEIEQPLV